MDDDALRHEAAAAASAATDGLPAALGRLLAVEPEERALRRLLCALAEAVPSADSAALLLGQGERFELAAAVGLDDETPERLDGGFAAEAARAPDLTVMAAPGAPFPRGTRCGVAAPIRLGAARGLVLLGTRAAGALDAGALALLRVAAERAGLALERERLDREREQALEEVRRAREEVQGRRAAVDYILGIVGHDLRNPLGAIHMSTALLQKRGDLAGWQARTVERMRSSVGRMGRIIADLLGYTRTRLGGGLPIDRREARLDEIARRVVDELRAANADRELTVEVSGDPGGEWDPDRLEQLASNLVSNAVDHGEPSTPVRVEVRGDGDACVLEVTNQGAPFPPEVLAHLFEPFSRPPDELSRKGSGLGLGLYISREIVRGHGGEIAVRSEGQTVVSVRLPRRPPG